MDRSQLERLREAAWGYYNGTDNADAMHLADVLGSVFRMIDGGTIETVIRFYEEEVNRGFDSGYDE